MDDQTTKNIVLAIALSLLVLLGWPMLFPPPEQAPTTPVSQIDGGTGDGPGITATTANGTVPTDISGAGPENLSVENIRRPLAIEGDHVSGSINLTDGRIDNVILTSYRETVEPDSDPITMFSPRDSENPYFAEIGWLDLASNSRLLNAETGGWTTPAETLKTGEPVVLTQTSASGLTVERIISVDDDYMFTITDRVTNQGNSTATLQPFGRISRTHIPDEKGNYIRHVGPISVLNETLEENDYKDLQKDGRFSFEDTQGWLGITDIYWLSAIAPTHDFGPFDVNFLYVESQDRFQVDYIGEDRTVAPGATIETTVHLFVGAKEINLLKNYQETLDIERFDMAIDFGWFFFLTKPLQLVIIYFAQLLGNFGLAILLVTVIIKLAFFPLANKSYVSMSKMKALQPKIAELREKYGEDKQRMQTELMALYKREKANPVAGCLPIALQIPVFFALYKVLFISIEMRQAPFYGWIKDLSAADPTTIANLFGLIPYSPPDFAMLGVWPIIMGITMFLQQKLNPAPPDPVQAKIFMFMPIMFTFFLAGFPAGLVIYWSWNNLLSMSQQYVIMRRMGVAVGGGKKS